MASSTDFPSIIMAAILITSMISTSNGLSYEQCLAMRLSPKPPPPKDPRALRAAQIRAALCRDAGRSSYLYFRFTGKLSPSYVKAVCNLFKDEEKVKSHIKGSYSRYDFDKIMDGRSCGFQGNEPQQQALRLVIM